MKIYRPFNFNPDYIFCHSSNFTRNKSIDFWNVFKDDAQLDKLYKKIVPCNLNVNFKIERDDEFIKREDALEDKSILRVSHIHNVVIGNSMMLDMNYNILILFIFIDDIPTILINTKLLKGVKLLRNAFDNILRNLEESIFSDIRIICINKDIPYLKELEITTDKPFRIAERIPDFLGKEEVKTMLKEFLWEE